ncbi:MAG: alpha/beta fold hydrolase [Dehalococcoidia bacterium]
MTGNGLRFVAAADGTRLQYDTAGVGEPIIFLHGGLDSRDSFRRQRLEFAARHRLVLRDLRGHNGSEWRQPADYGIETTEVDDLLRVLDAESIDRAHLVGHSSGGAIVFAFARRYPERVPRVVLIEPTLFRLLPEAAFAEQSAFYGGLAERAEAGDRIGAAHAVVANVAGGQWEARARPEAIALVDSAAAAIAPHLRALLALEVSSADALDLAAPALYIFGGRSAPFYRTLFDRISEANPKARRLFIDTAGHAAHLQRPEIVNPAVLEFLTA